MGVQIRTIISDNVARRCDGCLEIIEGTPWRINLLDIVAAETPVSWAERPAINPGPVPVPRRRRPASGAGWRAKGYLFCRRGEVREIMRPVPIPASAAAPRRGALGPVRRHPSRRSRVRPGLIRPAAPRLTPSPRRRLSSARPGEHLVPRFTQVRHVDGPPTVPPTAGGPSAPHRVDPEADRPCPTTPARRPPGPRDRALAVARAGQPAARGRSRHAPPLGRRRPSRGLDDARRPSPLRPPRRSSGWRSTGGPACRPGRSPASAPRRSA